MRELLTDARALIIELGAGNKLNDKGYKALDELLAKIDAALARPAPNAMEILRQVREQYPRAGELLCVLGISEAAALIEDYGKRVPRAMLYEINEFEDDYPRNIDPKMDAVAAKYGYRVE